MGLVLAPSEPGMIALPVHILDLQEFSGAYHNRRIGIPAPPGLQPAPMDLHAAANSIFSLTVSIEESFDNNYRLLL